MGSKTAKAPSTQKPQPAISPTQYAKILGGLHLVGLALTKCEAKADPQAAQEAFSQPEGPPLDMRDVASFESSGKHVTVRHNYSVISRYRRKALLSIKAEYTLVFETSEAFAADFFEVFKEIGVPMYTWPYVRELVDSMTSRMGLPKLVLPLLHTP